MRKFLTFVAVAALAVTACGGSSTPVPATSEPAPSSVSASTAPVTPAASSTPLTGTAVLSGWQSSTAEGVALTQTLLGFAAANPGIKVDYQPLAGDYPTVMATKFSSRDVPDVFYVDAAVAGQWSSAGYLQPLDDYIKASGFDVSKFYDGYLSTFKGSDGKIYGLPKDGNTIGMAYNTDLVPTPPKTMDELVTLAKSLKDKEVKAPICLNPGLDRGLAFLYAQGGSILSADGKSEAISSDASKTAVQWYLDLFKDGLGKTASDMGAGWCGDALGKKDAAIAFEGGWLDPAMSSTYPAVKYAWAPMPTGTSGSPVTISYTVSYSIGADSPHKDQAWALLSYLTGKDGMTSWTKGGVALPSRSDVPTPAGKDVLAAGSAYARPGSGFMPGYTDVQKAFQDAFTNEIQNKTFSADPIIAATKTAIEKALAQ
jgi:multiple sugar transport system substrate-binding protein